MDSSRDIGWRVVGRGAVEAVDGSRGNAEVVEVVLQHDAEGLVEIVASAETEAARDVLVAPGGAYGKAGAAAEL